ncbi:MAG: glycoside hydrolase family 15 protein, partial [Acidimicrobiales bacterium]
AGTSSLPEHMGGVRNWDYRYCWLRDAAWSLQSLARLGAVNEGLQFMDWLMEIIDRRGTPERLQPLYNVAGHHLPPEADLSELAGYAGSRPVRIGNAAEGQVQLDVFGPIVDLVASLQAAGVTLSHRHLGLVEASVSAVEARWREPDHGVWEERTRPRHHVSSKVMCWVAVDRAITIHQVADVSVPEDWPLLRDEIMSDVVEHGYSSQVGSFTSAYGDPDIDASVLHVMLSGMLRPDDPKVLSTVSAVESLLRDGPVVYRYLHDDGLPGREGAFLLTTSWLIESYLLIGEIARAEALFGELEKRPGPTGLMAEEYDPISGLTLGNLPQAYSHLGFINAALALDKLHERSSI